MEKHKWGKISHGQTYGLLANDIARRLSTIKLGDYEGILLNHIREYSWARSTLRKSRDGQWPDAFPFMDTIDSVASALCGPLIDKKSKSFKYIRRKLYEASKSLQGSKILVEATDGCGGLLINTNCGTWDLVGREILPAYASLAYCLASQNCTDPAPENSLLTPKDGTPEINKESQMDIPQEGYRCPSEGIHVSLRKDIDVPQEGYGPYIGTGASEDLRRPKKIEEKEIPPHPPETGGYEVTVDSPTQTQAPHPEIGTLIDGIRDAAILHRQKAGYPGDTIAIENAVRHAQMLCCDHKAADVFSAYLSAIESNPKPGKWGQAVATNLARRIVRHEEATAKIKSSGVAAASKASPNSNTMNLSAEERANYLAFKNKGVSR